LERDYVHHFVTAYYQAEAGSIHDPPIYRPSAQFWIEKRSGPAASALQPTTSRQSWAHSVDDVAAKSIVTHLIEFDPSTLAAPVLDDAVFGGTYTGAATSRNFAVLISSLGGGGTSDKFDWYDGLALGGSDIPITGGEQLLRDGVFVKFGAKVGHSLELTYPSTSPIPCGWIGSIAPNNDITRYGVGARGKVTTASNCVAVNSHILVTSEDDAIIQASPTAIKNHALVVRNADTLAVLYRKPLTHDGTGYAWGDPAQKFSFSTNLEGLWFMHCYTVPVLSSPPTPYPGAEFGSPNRRKVAVISVNPTTYEPTIEELITLEDNQYTGQSRFVVAHTVGEPSDAPVVIGTPPVSPGLPDSPPPTTPTPRVYRLSIGSGITGAVDDVNVTYTTDREASVALFFEVIVDGVTDWAATWTGTTLTTSSAPHSGVSMIVWR
jgi:hypothetical protein